MKESVIVDAVARYLQQNHPKVIFRFDLFADTPMPHKLATKNRQLHGKHTRGYPDLIILGPGGKPYFLELKATTTVPNTEHTRRQRKFHKKLRRLGYKVDFCCGLRDCLDKIIKYLNKG